MTNHERTWEIWAASWKAATAEEKRGCYEKVLSPDCVYTDPLTQVRGWDELLAYMLEFHRQVPGGHFVTQEFMAHHDRSIARWEMRDGNGTAQGNGISYGEYDDRGRLIAMNGFYQVPGG